MAQGNCDWRDWDAYLAEFRRVIEDPGVSFDRALAFTALHLPLDARERGALARRIALDIEGRVPRLPPRALRAAPARLRIGVLSPDFRDHVNASLLLPLFELADRRRFEIYAYSLAKDDGSLARDQVRRSAHRFRDLSALTSTDAAHQIRRDEIDILIDAGGHSEGARFEIMAARAAPLQVLYLGFASTLGSKCIDYVIVDRVVAPPQSPEEWTEARAYLPSTYYLYDFRIDVPDVSLSRRDYALPEDAFVYCAFHKAEKITPDAFDSWMRVLRSVGNSVIWFLAVPAAAIANLRSGAEARGVDPSRLHFAPRDPRSRYLARQRLGDLMLDCFHHSAMTTACDALAAGLPVLTVKGQSMASRAGESLLRAAGLPELMAEDADAFCQRAIQLAKDAQQLGELRRKLKGSRYSAPLFDTAARVRELCAAFDEMWRRQAAGLPPTVFSVQKGGATGATQ